MSHSNSYLCHVAMQNGLPVGENAAIVKNAIDAYKKVETMTKAKFRLRFVARGKRGITLKNCSLAAVYIYMKRY